MELAHTPSATTAPPAASEDIDEVTISQTNAIPLPEALAIARDNGVPLGKSTLQKWAKTWADTPNSPVKVVLQVTRTGRHYELDRDDFESWLLDQAQNEKTLKDPARPVETPPDPTRSHETRQDLSGPHEASPEATQVESRLKELEHENMNLKIDLGVRKQLLDRAKDEIDGIRTMTDSLLRENGALQYQLQLLPPPQANGSNSEVLPSVDNPDKAESSAV